MEKPCECEFKGHAKSACKKGSLGTRLHNIYMYMYVYLLSLSAYLGELSMCSLCVERLWEGETALSSS